MKYVVEIFDLRSQETRSSCHYCETAPAAIERAVGKLYGRTARFYHSRELFSSNQVYYGQIGKFIPKLGASSMITGRVRIDVDSV